MRRSVKPRSGQCTVSWTSKTHQAIRRHRNQESSHSDRRLVYDGLESYLFVIENSFRTRINPELCTVIIAHLVLISFPKIIFACLSRASITVPTPSWYAKSLSRCMPSIMSNDAHSNPTVFCGFAPAFCAALSALLRRRLAV